MYRTYICKSFREDLGTVYLSKHGEYGWKLDVQDAQGEWHRGGDQVESTIDEIMPYLARYVDNDCVWREQASGRIVSFWTIISSELLGSE